MSDSKVLLTYKNGNGHIQVESVWATKEGEYYRIDNVPFFAPNIAFHDLVSVQNDEGELHFDDLIQASGHSTVQIVFFDSSKFGSVTERLVEFKCSWEGSHLPRYISVDIPVEVDYKVVRKYLIEMGNNGLLDFKEACLAHSIAE